MPEQVQPCHPGLVRGLVEVVPELVLGQALDSARLLLRGQVNAIVRRLALARLAVHAGRERAALDGAFRRVAALALEVELGALAAAEPADRAAVVRHLDAPPLRRTAAVVRDRRDVGDRAGLQASRLQRAGPRLTAGTRPPPQHPPRA